MDAECFIVTYATYVARYVLYLVTYVANAIIIITIIILCTYVRMFTRMCFVRTYVAGRTETEVESTAKGVL